MSLKSSQPIHEWFGLSYTSYFVIPRLALQAMPVDWQERFLALMDEAFKKHNLSTPGYHVLRTGSYTLVKKYDEDDDSSRDYEFTAIEEDPWANYRRGDINELCPEFRAIASASPSDQQEGGE